MKLLIPDLWYADVPKGASVIAMKGFHQTDFYSCGYAAAATILKALGIRHTKKALWDIVSPSKEIGVTWKGFARSLRCFGCKLFQHRLSRRNIMNEIDQGNPMVITARLPWQKKGEEHWMVISGYRAKGSEILLLNHTRRPWRSHVWIKLADLRKSMSEPAMLVVEAHLDLLEEDPHAIPIAVVT